MNNFFVRLLYVQKKSFVCISRIIYSILMYIIYIFLYWWYIINTYTNLRIGQKTYYSYITRILDIHGSSWSPFSEPATGRRNQRTKPCHDCLASHEYHPIATWLRLANGSRMQDVKMDVSIQKLTLHHAIALLWGYNRLHLHTRYDTSM